MRLLITGASGQLGGYLLRATRNSGMSVIAWSGSRTGEVAGIPLRPVDLATPEQIAFAFEAAQPTVVIHAGALTGVNPCFDRPQHAALVNVQGAVVLAELAAASGARLILVSTDLVFDGNQGWYKESDPPTPLSTYARTKVLAEQTVLSTPRNAVIRLSLFFGPTVIGRPSLFDQQIEGLRSGARLELFDDEWRTPISLLSAARALIALAESGFVGLVHLGGPECLSRFEMGLRLAAFLGHDISAITAVSRKQSQSAEPRPRDVSLDSSQWRRLFPEVPWPPWSDAVREMLR